MRGRPSAPWGRLAPAHQAGPPGLHRARGQAAPYAVRGRRIALRGAEVLSGRLVSWRPHCPTYSVLPLATPVFFLPPRVLAPPHRPTPGRGRLPTLDPAGPPCGAAWPRPQQAGSPSRSRHACSRDSARPLRAPRQRAPPRARPALCWAAHTGHGKCAPATRTHRECATPRMTGAPLPRTSSSNASAQLKGCRVPGTCQRCKCKRAPSKQQQVWHAGVCSGARSDDGAR